MKKKQNSYWKNVLLTILVAFAVVSFWRGVWGLMDHYLFPNNRSLSYLISILFGIIILLSSEKFLEKLS